MERHPLQPFLPDGAKILMLGSFPPARHRWCMNFFYPNYINDMWRIFGHCLYGDKNHFVDEEQKTFRREAIIEMLQEQGIALYDTAVTVRRLKNTASDKDLEVVEPTDLSALISQLPQLQTVVTTGEKATGLLAAHFGINAPRVGSYVDFTFDGRTLRFYRMPSSSRAYPMRLENKAEYYRQIIHN